jgi:F-box/leucine-rich repeat protein 10/11
MSNPAVASQEEEGTTRHANRHVAKFLKIPQSSTESEDPMIQIIHDGQQLTADRLLENQSVNLRQPILVKDSPQSIGMKLLGKKGNTKVTLRDIAQLLGNHYPVHVIDVEHQEELEGWSLGDLVDYFEDEARLMQLRRFQGVEKSLEAKDGSVEGSQCSRRRRRAADKCIQMTDQKRPRVLNQISLEFSQTKMMEKVLSPRFVREMDWIDIAWPRRKKPDGSLERAADEEYPNVQYYCLTSAAGCYTDFHVDFGGTSVWYHVLNGEKDFCLIPPTKENLAIYEDWLCRPDQTEIFLPDMVPNPENNVVRVSLKESQTLIIPTAWIHGVYTPKDSLVFGGNFLHGADIPLQLAVHCLETRTRVQEKFRFPHFLPMNFYAGGFYLDKLRRGTISKVEVEGLEVLIDALEEWWKVHKHSQSQRQTGLTVASAAMESARGNHCDTVEAFLEALRHEHLRVTKDGISPNPATPIRSDPMKIPAAPIEDSSSSGKPKLRLSIKTALRSESPEPSPARSDDVLDIPSVGAAKLRLSLKGKLATSAPNEELEHVPVARNMPPKTIPDFRIIVSSPGCTSTLPSKQKRPREDKEWIDDCAPLEDEWIPPPRKDTRKNHTVKATNARASANPPTSRERLMKRFR